MVNCDKIEISRFRKAAFFALIVILLAQLLLYYSAVQQGYRNYLSVDLNREKSRPVGIYIGMHEYDVFRIRGFPDYVSYEIDGKWSKPESFFFADVDCRSPMRLYYCLPTFLGAISIRRDLCEIIEIDKSGRVAARINDTN